MKITLIKNVPITCIKNKIVKYIPVKYILPKTLSNTNSFTKNSDILDIGRINDFGIKHFRLINSNSIRGVTLSNQNPKILKELKECGINHIIDLRREANSESKYANNCKENGLKYFPFPININMPIFNIAVTSKMSMQERKDSINSFIKLLPQFFKTMNEGRVYMACLLGLHRTDLAVTLNYLINPIEPASPPILSHMLISDETNMTNKYIGAMKNLIKNLSDEDKEKLGLPKNFVDKFNTRITKLRMMNGNKV